MQRITELRLCEIWDCVKSLDMWNALFLKKNAYLCIRNKNIYILDLRKTEKMKTFHKFLCGYIGFGRPAGTALEFVIIKDYCNHFSI